MTNIFVGNLSFDTSQDELQTAFAEFGAVERVNIVTDRDTGQPRGFAFVEMTEKDAAEKAIAQLNGTELGGRGPFRWHQSLRFRVPHPRCILALALRLPGSKPAHVS